MLVFIKDSWTVRNVSQCVRFCIIYPWKGAAFPDLLLFLVLLFFLNDSGNCISSLGIHVFLSHPGKIQPSLTLSSWITYPVRPSVSFPWLSHTRFVLVHNQLHHKAHFPVSSFHPPLPFAMNFSVSPPCVKITSYLPYQDPLWHFFSRSFTESIRGCPAALSTVPSPTGVAVVSGSPRHSWAVLSRNMWGGWCAEPSVPPWSWAPTWLSCSSASCPILKLGKPWGRDSSFVLFSTLRKWKMTAPWAALLVTHPKCARLWF